MTGDLHDVVGYYEASQEEERLRGAGELELCRTQEVLRRHLGPPPQRILDVGGGTGVHAGWLIADGHRVHLVDLSPRHVRLATADLAAAGLTAAVGDARHLPQADGSADAVLLLGPLYHLQRPDDRIAALREARRVVVPGGIVAAAAISRFASLFDGLARGFLLDEAFRAIVGRDLESGCHENPQHRPDWFTTAYLHHPDELAREIEESGLQLVELLGLEGLAGWLPDLERRWRDGANRAVVLESARLTEAEPALLGLSAHLLAVARA